MPQDDQSEEIYKKRVLDRIRKNYGNAPLEAAELIRAVARSDHYYKKKGDEHIAIIDSARKRRGCKTDAFGHAFEEPEENAEPAITEEPQEIETTDTEQPFVEIYDTEELARLQNEAKGYSGNDVENCLDQFVGRGNKRHLVVAYEDFLEDAKSIAEQFPNMRDVAIAIIGSIAIAARNGSPIRLPRLLVNGPPGCGKTEFFRSISSVLDLEVIELQLGFLHGRFELIGGHRSWRQAEWGILTKKLLMAKTGNPLVLFDEACSATNEIFPGLLQVVEDEKYRDNFLDMWISARQVNMAFLSNFADKIPGNLRSRLTRIEVDQPTGDDRRRVIRQIYDIVATGDFACFAEQISDDMIDKLMTCQLREAREMIRLAMYTAAYRGDMRVSADDITGGDPQLGNGIGFLAKVE